MGYAEFDALLKKINLKPKGVKEIVLEISDGALAGKIDMLSELIDSKIAISVDSQVVRYNVQINARTQEPIKRYQVDNAGIVSEVKKEEGEQIEMSLGLPKDKTPIADVPVEISREVVDEFILEGFAPNFDDLPYSFIDWLLRLEAGETYSRIATIEELSNGVVVEKLDEYRRRVAPLAAKWDEWREREEPVVEAADPEDGNAEGEEPDGQQESEGGQEGAEVSDAGEDPENEPGSADPEEDGTEPPAAPQRSISEENDAALMHEMEGGSHLINQDAPDWLQEGDGDGEPDGTADEQQGSVDAKDTDDQAGGEPEGSEEEKEPFNHLDAFILSERPVFPEVEYQGRTLPFPDMLEKRLKEGKTWREIANEEGMTSGQLSSRWSMYKKLAAKKQGGGGAA